MADTRNCPHCGKPVPPTALPGICPECMLKAGLATRTEVAGTAGSQDNPAVPPLPGPEELAPLFPQLQILKCLGRGGMGVVYQARQPRLNRLVALKILAREKEKDPRFAERFAREAQALARLNHPNIVTVHDFGETDGLCYLLMEYVDGLSLRQVLRSGRMKAAEALGIVPKICEALQYAHDQGVIHRDIKPENILLDKTGRVKIADFGIAKMMGAEPGDPNRGGADNTGEGGKAGTAARRELTEAGQVVGTPNYMAPEQRENPVDVDHRADIYSLGVVFYEMLTGELPLGRFQPPSRRVQVDVRLDEVVLHALEKEPALRYQQASQVKTDVETIAKSETRKPKSETDEPAGLTRSWAGFPVVEERNGKPAVLWVSALILWIVCWGGLSLLIPMLWLVAGDALEEFISLPAFLGLGAWLSTVFVGVGVGWARWSKAGRSSRGWAVGATAVLAAGVVFVLGVQPTRPASREVLTQAPAPAPEPVPGWFPAGSHPRDYEMARDRNITRSGKASAYLRSVVPQPAGFGTLLQSFKADAYRGQRVRLSGFLRSEAVQNWAGLWLRVDGPGDEVLSFDNMQDRAVRGTTDWTRHEIVLDVPESASAIFMGLLLTGPGQVWMDDLKFEAVDKDVAATGGKPGARLPRAPQLEFAE